MERTTKRTFQLFFFLVFALICLAITTGVVVYSALIQNINSNIVITFKAPKVVLNMQNDEGSALSSCTLVYNENNNQFRIDGPIPNI